MGRLSEQPYLNLFALPTMSRESLVEDGELYYIKVNSRGSSEEAPFCGEKWDDGSWGKVKEVCIWHGDYVYGIQVTYERNGTILVSARHGGNEGDFEQIQFHEPITCVSGYYGSWRWDPELLANEEEAPLNYTLMIRSLTFRTGQDTYGPFGCEIGTPFHFKMNTGCAGFHGRSYSNGDYGYLSAIGVYAATLAKNTIVGGFSPSVPPSLSIIREDEGKIEGP